MHDLRFAFRQLVRSPGFTVIAVLSLALGIGATTTVFCWIQGIVMHPLRGVERQEQMVVLTTIHDKQMWDTVGIRMALGANTTDILRLIFREGFFLAAAGIAVGLTLTVIATRLIASFLYGVSPFDLAIFIGVPVLLSLVSLLACWLPARNATLIDPITALRSE